MKKITVTGTFFITDNAFDELNDLIESKKDKLDGKYQFERIGDFLDSTDGAEMIYHEMVIEEEVK